MQIYAIIDFRGTYVFRKNNSCAYRLTNLIVENIIEFV